MVGCEEILDAARYGELEQIKEYFKGPNAAEEFMQLRAEGSQCTPIHLAAANAEIEVLEYILSNLGEHRTACVNAQNDMGNTALHWACLTGSLDAVKLLVGAGADAFTRNQAGKDSVFEAENSGNEAIAEFLLSAFEVPEADDAEQEADIDPDADIAADAREN